MTDERRKEVFGITIKEFRLERNLSLRAVAEKADISHSYLSQVELGKRNIPSPDIVKKIALALEIDYFVLARIAGYLDAEGKMSTNEAQFEGFDYMSKTRFNTIEFKVPSVIRTDEEDVGTTVFRFMSPEESKEKFLDLDYLLNSNENIYFKNKLLNEHERQKVLKLLELIIDDYESSKKEIKE